MNGFQKYLAEKYIVEDYRELKKEMLTFLSDEYGDHYDSEADWVFDAEAAIYWYAHDYYDGQSSDLYKILSTTDYKPGSGIKNISDIGETSEEMYNSLVNKYEEKSDEEGEIE